jgi:hypothetical protein
MAARNGKQQFDDHVTIAGTRPGKIGFDCQ